MAVFSAIITFAGSAVQVTGASGVASEEMSGALWPTGALAWRAMFQPMRANTHQCWVGHGDVTNNGTGNSMWELLAPQATSPLDSFEIQAAGGDRNFDPSNLYVHGTSGEKIRVNIWSA